MDGSRARRTRDRARRAWYAGWRQYRFARHYGFLSGTTASGANVAGSPMMALEIDTGVSTGSTASGANVAGGPMMACAFDTAAPAPSSPLPSAPMLTPRAVPALVIAEPEAALPVPPVLTQVPKRARAALHLDLALDTLQHDFDLSWVT